MPGPAPDTPARGTRGTSGMPGPAPDTPARGTRGTSGMPGPAPDTPARGTRGTSGMPGPAPVTRTERRLQNPLDRLPPGTMLPTVGAVCQAP
jgi:hypothetical protein